MSRRYLHPNLPGPGEQVELDAPTSHHVLRVCRLPRGHTLSLFDGEGRETQARLVDVRGGRAIVEALEAARTETQPHRLILLIAICKGPAFERILRMATELGVTSLLPVYTARAVPRGAHGERWDRILVSAAAQCGRPDLPDLEEARLLSQALALPHLPACRRVLIPGAVHTPCPDDDRALLVGPEGGLTEDEVRSATEAGFLPAGLARWTLRADTAVAAALARYGG